MRHAYLYVSISVSGASVLAVEILGTRILGPHFGVHLYLWSALITVTLAALALGYELGGRWADRGATMRRLCVLLAAAGVWIALIPALRGPAVAAARALGPRPAMIGVSIVLFFPPLAVLGMASPYALKLRAQSLEGVGRAAGDLFAISTLASMAAALCTGFVLVPSFGVSRLCAAIGIVLAAAALPGLLGADSGGRRQPRTAVSRSAGPNGGTP